MELIFEKNKGIASLVFAAVSFLLMFFFFLVIVPFVKASYPSADATPALIMGGLWLGIFVLLGLGIFSGFAGLFDKKTSFFSGLGFLFNLLFLGVYVLGLKFFV